MALFASAVARPQRYEAPHGDDGHGSDESGYNFSWSVEDEDSEENKLYYGHQESRDDGVTKGEYYVLLPDTRLMKVEYIADEDGYRPTVTFEGEAQFDEESKEYYSKN